MFEDILVKKTQSKLGVVYFGIDFKTENAASSIGDVAESIINAVLHIDFEGFEHNDRKAVLKSCSVDSGRVDLQFELYDMTDECQKEIYLKNERVQENNV